MARPRADTGPAKEPHSLSLKVLRYNSQAEYLRPNTNQPSLARPSLADQHPLPTSTLTNIPAQTSLAHPFSDPFFNISSNLILPSSFGSAYVGESFSCSLCANNESLTQITNVQLTAEMQTPSQRQISLPTSSAPSTLDLKETLQQIVSHDLKEEGNHVLIVNLSYTDTRNRTFRKLYQFQAQPCLNVRTKATELPSTEVPDKSLGPYGRQSLVRYVLEAQLENVSDGGIVLENAQVLAFGPFKARSLNWDVAGGEGPSLLPRDIFQLAFLVEQDAEATEGVDELKANMKQDGRTALGQIALEWRSAMGEKGQLTTGTLFSRRRV